MGGVVFNMDGTKYCSSCGTQMDENVNICPECGINQTARHEKSVRYEKSDIDYIDYKFWSNYSNCSLFYKFL